MTSTSGNTAWRHLLASLSEAGRVLAYQTLDLAGSDASWLRKYLECRALASRPQLAGLPWRLDLRLAGPESDPHLRLSAFLAGPFSECVAREGIPLGNLLWIGVAMARQLGIASADYQGYQVAFEVLDEDDPLLHRDESNLEDEDFVVSEEATGLLRFTEDFSTRPPGPLRQSIRDVPDGWMRCAFTEGAWEQFAAAAEAEGQVERAFGAPMCVHLADGRCYLVIGQPVVELPAEASPTSLITSGRELLKLHRRFSGQFAYCHLHPRSVEGVAMTPYPSGPDVTVAWNLNASTALPICMPIALWGTGREPKPGEAAAHAFVKGLLTEIPLEVVGDNA